MNKKNTEALEQINKLIFVQAYEKAWELLNDLVQESPGDPVIELRRIELSLKNKESDQLIKEYSQQEQSTGNSIYVALKNIAMFFSERESPMEASLALQGLIKNEASALVYYGIATALDAEGQHDRALYNYNQSLKIDPEFYPTYFGISQVYYHQGNNEQGDYFFYMYEQKAPYNLYGNFETHRQLALDFAGEGNYIYAKRAVQTLSEWWIENKTICPIEIVVFEELALSKIAAQNNAMAESRERLERATDYAKSYSKNDDVTIATLFFMAKLFEEYSSDARYVANKMYEKIISSPHVSSDYVQKIAGHLFASGKTQDVLEVFALGYEQNADHPDIRFCLLVSQLKLNKVDVEEYLTIKDRLNTLIDQDGDKVEIFSALHALLSRFSGDAEIHMILADLYKKTGHQDKAKKHYENMYTIDWLGSESRLRYAEYLVGQNNEIEAEKILKELMQNTHMTQSALFRMKSLQVDILQRKGDHKEALKHLSILLRAEPWNIGYLIKQIQLIYSDQVAPQTGYDLDPVVKSLETNRESQEKDWTSFDKLSEIFLSLHYYEYVYARYKLKFLFFSERDTVLKKLVHLMGEHFPEVGVRDLFKLLNTNFDRPQISFSIGKIYKSMWMHETAVSWLEHALNYENENKSFVAEVYREMADSYLWGNLSHDRALEFAKLAIDYGEFPHHGAHAVYAHALIKAGRIREAEISLEKVPKNDIDGQYLRGIIDYRNGKIAKAQGIWQDVFKTSEDTIKVHRIKEELAKYYYHQVDYIKKAN